jgi:hypothetical protein
MNKEDVRTMRIAVSELFKIGCTTATPNQILEVAQKHELEVWLLESEYLDEVDRCAEE